MAGIEIVPLKVMYPQAVKKIAAVTGLWFRLHAGTADRCGRRGVQCFDGFAVYQAVLKNKPLIERVVTVTGRFEGAEEPDPAHGYACLGAVGGRRGLPEDARKVISGPMGRAMVNRPP